MDSVLIDGRLYHFQLFDKDHVEKLEKYLAGLSIESKNRFGPHEFNAESLLQLLNSPLYTQFIAINYVDDEVVAYTIVKSGWVDFDGERLRSYGLYPEETDFTIAPSVADAYQNKGMGTAFFNYQIRNLKSYAFMRRLILWGGVQKRNERAVQFYNKLGFQLLGEFEHNGSNFDMMLEV